MVVVLEAGAGSAVVADFSVTVSGNEAQHILIS
jgi:hypothetical protein